jgi:uncharacterized protein
MNLAVFANTPAQIHFFKNIVKKIESDGNNVYMLIRAQGEARDIAQELGISYYSYSSESNKLDSSKLSKMLSVPHDILRAYDYLKNLNINLITGFGLYDAYESFLLRVPSIIFTDDEPKSVSKIFNAYFNAYYPFISTLITPTSFRCDYGKKHYKINSFKELSYLHPKYYTPNDDIYDILKIDRSEPFVLLRFNSFKAFHDFYITGFSEDDKIKLANDMERYAHVFITNEGELSSELKKYQIKIPKSRIHDVLYYTNLFITDTATMATEAAILGTPTIRCNSLVGENDLGNFIELEKKFHLISNHKYPQTAIEKANELIQIPNLKKTWRSRSNILLEEKIDISEFFYKLIINYPESINW